MGLLEREQLAVMGAANVAFEALRSSEEADIAPNTVAARLILDEARDFALRSISLGSQAPMRRFELDGLGDQTLGIVAGKCANLSGGLEETDRLLRYTTTPPLGELFTPPNPPTLSDLAK